MGEEALRNLQAGMQALRTQIGAQSIPTRFEEGNIVEWLDTFDGCAAANQWDDAARLRRLPTFLRGRAFAIFLRLEAGRRDTIAHLRQSLIDEFLPAEERGVRYQEFDTCSMKPSESVDNYVLRLEQLLTMAIPALAGEAREAILKQRFMKGLEPDIRRRLYENPTLTYVQCITTAKQLLTASKQVAEEGTSLGATGKSPNTESTLDLSKVKTEPSATSNFVGRKSHPLSQNRQQQFRQSSQYNAVKCLTCGGFGHLSRVCPSGNPRNYGSNFNRCRNNYPEPQSAQLGHNTRSNSQTNFQGARGGNNQKNIPTCYVCGKLGHKALGR